MEPLLAVKVSRTVIRKKKKKKKKNLAGVINRYAFARG